MARVLPSDWASARAAASGAVLRELETLALLEQGLSESLTVFHGVHWSRAETGIASLGEIDFVVLAPSGRVLLIEQKSGFLVESDDGLAKRYPSGTKLVRLQVDRTLEALYRRLASIAEGMPLAIDYLLYCPDYAVKKLGTAGIAPERIVDASRREQLCRRICAALGVDGTDAGKGGPDAGPNASAADGLVGSAPHGHAAAAVSEAQAALATRLRRFFANELQLAVDVSTLVGRAGELVTRLSGGLSTWARRIAAEPFRLRVMGTAGSGKTQLALAVLEDAAAAGRRAIYVCFNRPLADHMRRIAPAQAQVFTYHQWCEHRLRAAGRSVDFGERGAFERLEREAQALPVLPESRADCLVIDEGQDFTPDWRDAVLALAAPGAHCWWLEDPMQNLYGRAPIALPDWIELAAPVNYRSPRRIAHTLARLVDGLEGVQCQSPVSGEDIEFLTYADSAGLVESTKRAITLAMQGGFRRTDLALVTYSGRERSVLLGFDALGPHRLRSFAGQYDLLGNPVYGDGDLLIETVYRFKGQSAPCVVLTEVDFESFDEAAQRKLFVGLTRASMRAVVVLSERAAATLLARLG